MGDEPLLHVDADAFFAAVETRDDPGLAGLPLAVVDRIVCCASYEARAWGVRAGMPVARARATCPSLVTTPPRMAAYQRVSGELFELLDGVATAVQPGSMEEAFVRLPGLSWTGAEWAARDLRRRIRAELALPVSIGVGRTKLIAKLASRAAKPNGIVLTRPADEPALRAALRIHELWGVGPVTCERLADAGIHTVADLGRWSVADLAGLAGAAMGRLLHEVVTGTDDAEVRPVRAPRTFSVQRAGPVSLHDLAGELADRLRAEHLTCHTLHVRLTFADGRETGARTRFDPPTSDPRTLTDAARRLVADPMIGMRMVRLVVADLRPWDTCPPPRN